MKTPALLRDQRGAALAEFVAVATPLFVTFFSLVQLGLAYTAKLVVEHSARVAARAAAVIAPPNPDAPRDAGEQIRRAAEVAMGPWAESHALGDVRVRVKPPDAPFAELATEVRATYTCSVPVGGRIVCGIDGRWEMTGHAAFPSQGARYRPFERRRP
jgi:Flp pilus assembly protein TadG